MKQTRISFCMIVKNEEDFIGRCLSSVQDVVDEMIIVDTGSTDQTIKICQSFPCRIEKFAWNDNFADARNFGISKATGDWILWLDADEELDATERYRLREGTHFDEYDVLTVHLINYHGDRVDPINSTDIAHTRLFRNNGIRFINPIHECLDIAALPAERIGHLNIKVHHYGYLDTVVEKKSKFERNVKLLLAQLVTEENAHWIHYYLAMEFYRNKKFEEAFERVNLSIRAFLMNQSMPPSMLYKLKYSILVATGSFDGAWPGIDRAILLYPDYVDLYFIKGMILYATKRYEEALNTFEECLEIGEDNLNHLILRGVGSFQAWHYKGLCLQKLGKREEATVAFLKALAIAPTYRLALDSLHEIIQEDGVSLTKCLDENFQGDDYQKLVNLLKK